MAVRIESHAEPIPGYRLIERLGGGGFGEVWKAEAPGGLLKAIKFVYGDLQTAGDEGMRAEQELKALSRVKTVRHPYILSLERYDIIDSQLLIVMELADRNLWDRFKECRTLGLPGIPREEILRYLEETAEALDLMNAQYQLQHLDIKPQNLFLVHNHVKVADFGLVKDLEGMVASVTGGVTPVYAAPETFDGWVSRFCDQYSLAIVYQELLTGQRPFSGSSVRQLIMQHLQAAPNLEPLPPEDRQAIGRALAKNPDERHPTCLDLVRALRGAASDSKKIGPRSNGQRSAENGSLTPPRDTQVLDAVTSTPREDVSVCTDSDPSKDNALIWNPGNGQGPPTHWIRTTTDQKADPPVPQAQGSAGQRVAPAEITGSGVLVPALIIGIGQRGLSVLQRLREELYDRFGDGEALPHLRLLYLDTDPEVLRSATRGTPGAALTAREILLTRLCRPSHYLKPREGRVRIDTWFNPRMLYRIPRNQVTSGLRALGRLAFCDHYEAIARRLRAELEACTDPEALAAADKQTGLGLRSNRPRVYVVTSLAGGTGSGMFLDLSYVVRSLLKQLGYAQPDVTGLFLLPKVESNSARTLALGNTFAALTELNHFSSPGVTFSARYHELDAAVSDPDPPFNHCFLLPLEEGSEEEATRQAVGLAGEFLYRNLCTPFGAAADRERTGLAPSPHTKKGLLCQTFGVYRLTWPRQALTRRIARNLCQRLVQRWMNKDSAPVREPVQAWVHEQWDKQKLGAEHFIGRLQEACERALGHPPEAVFAAILDPAALVARHDPKTPDKGPKGKEPDMDGTAVRQALGRLDELLGRPDSEPGARPVVLADALAKASDTLVNDWEKKLAELAVRLIEQPEFRLAGAEEALRVAISFVEQVLQQHEAPAGELAKRAADACSRIHTLLDTLAKNPAGGRRSAGAAAELLELLRFYPAWRFQGLVLQQVNRAFVSLRGHLSDELREINYCRARLAELLRLLSEEDSASKRPGDQEASVNELGAVASSGPGRSLFPAGCQTLDEAVAHFLEDVTLDEVRDLDGQMQQMIHKQFSALVHVCLTSSNMLKDLEAALLREAERFAAGRLGNADVAEMFLHQYSQEEEKQSEIADAFDKAAPELAGTTSSCRTQYCLLAVPPGPAGERFRRLAEQALPRTPLSAAASADDVVFYRELPHVAVADLEHLGPLGSEAYRQMTTAEHFTPHSRSDITEWRAASG